METKAVFERKVALTPRDLNRVAKKVSIDDLIVEKLAADMEGKCSQHGWVIPGSLQVLSRSMCQSEPGRFTGSMVSWVQFEARVYYPIDGMVITGDVIKKNKMGMFVMYNDAIQIMVPRDLHLGDEAYDGVDVNDTVQVEIKKSRFQVNDPYILSVGVFKGYAEAGAEDGAAAAAAPAIPVEGDEAFAVEGPEVDVEVEPVAAAVAATPAPGMEIDLDLDE
jgi:DNA-directed RNA polymerase subunit E'/Rpb7